jgi:glycosyltransferase involved in cell wall biosynthesis
MERGKQHRAGIIKLAFLVRSLDYGGAQRQLITLAKALDKSQFEVTVLTFYADQPMEQELDGGGVRLIPLDKHGRWDLIAFLRRLISEVKTLQPDVIHGYLDIPNLLALFLKRIVPARVVWGVRASDMDLRRYDWLFRSAARIETMMARFPDLIIVNSVAALEHHLAKGFPAHKMKLIPNGIDTDYFKPDGEARSEVRAEWRIPERIRLVGTVGRLDPVKDLPVFLKAARLILDQMNDVRFVCVGSGPAAYVEQLNVLVDDLGLGESVTWTGARSDVVGVYNALDLLVSSSRAESFPNSVAEAMSCGLPCVVTDVGDSALLIADRSRVVPAQNPEALAAAIIQALQSDRAELGSQNRARIIENFGASHLARLTEQAIKEEWNRL